MRRIALFLIQESKLPRNKLDSELKRVAEGWNTQRRKERTNTIDRQPANARLRERERHKEPRND